MSRDNLQILVDQTAPGETLKLAAGEYQGPLAVSKPVTIDGCVQDGKIRTTIWSQQGPVISITADDVRFHNLNVEVTMQNGDSDNDADVAIKSEPGIQVGLDNVTVRGRLVGLDGEAGDWLLPRSLDLGMLAARKPNRLVLKVYVPVPCQVSTKVSGLTVKPVALQQGLNEVALEVRDLCKDCFISGTILVRSAFVYRSIEITGRTPTADDIDPVADVLIWEPKDVPTPESEPVRLPELVVEEPPRVDQTSVAPQSGDTQGRQADSSIDAPTTDGLDAGDARQHSQSSDISVPAPDTETVPDADEPVPPSIPVVMPKPQPGPIDTSKVCNAPIKAKSPPVYRKTDGKVSTVFQPPTPVATGQSQAGPGHHTEAVAPVSDVFSAVNQSDDAEPELPRPETPSVPKTRSIPNPSVFGGRPDTPTPQSAPSSADEGDTKPVPVEVTASSSTRSRRVTTPGVSRVFGSNVQPTASAKAQSSDSACPPDPADAADNDKQECRLPDESPQVDAEPARGQERTSKPRLGGAFK